MGPLHFKSFLKSAAAHGLLAEAPNIRISRATDESCKEQLATLLASSPDLTQAIPSETPIATFVKGGVKIVSAWEAFNAVQGYVQHDAQAKTGFKSNFARILRAANDTHVSIAEKIALAA